MVKRQVQSDRKRARFEQVESGGEAGGAVGLRKAGDTGFRKAVGAGP
ncbi:hypothetical protein HMPREF0972_02417 [Actinomyces sp. oral taxon 848 str. F0332]|nr:hypothetical protein HMPREF0972_02417 [Actinomyces sp. oral taxon 848 str. F0332]